MKATQESMQAARNEWQPIATAPKDCYIIGFDPCLKRPFVMIWNMREGQFVQSGGFGDEAPTLWMPLPPIPGKSAPEIVDAAERARAVVSTLYAALNDASSVVDRGEGEDYAYQSQLKLARNFLGIEEQPVCDTPAGDMGCTERQLEAKYGTEHPSYTREDWREDVAQGNTRLGYWAWVLHNVESHYGDPCDKCGATECDKVFVSDVGYVCHNCTSV